MSEKRKANPVADRQYQVDSTTIRRLFITAITFGLLVPFVVLMLASMGPKGHYVTPDRSMHQATLSESADILESYHLTATEGRYGMPVDRAIEIVAAQGLGTIQQSLSGQEVQFSSSQAPALQPNVTTLRADDSHFAAVQISESHDSHADSGHGDGHHGATLPAVVYNASRLPHIPHSLKGGDTPFEAFVERGALSPQDITVSDSHGGHGAHGADTHSTDTHSIDGHDTDGHSVDTQTAYDVDTSATPIVDAQATTTPVEDAPVEDVPVEDVPVEDVPVEDVPVEDAVTLEETSDVTEGSAVDAIPADDSAVDTSVEEEVLPEASSAEEDASQTDASPVEDTVENTVEDGSSHPIEEDTDASVTAQDTQDDASATSTEVVAAPAEAMLINEAGYSNCIACHQTTGQGVPAAFPPLVGHVAELYKAERDYLPRLMLNGLQGQIEIDGMSYNGAMVVTWPHLSDEEIAGVLNYTLTSWGNDALLPADFQPYTAEDIAVARDNIVGMQGMYQYRQEVIQ